MGNHLNRGNDLYMKLTRDDFFVDKSSVIAYLNGCISGSEGKYICVSRPTRFGKSCVADMLTAYYSRECDSRAIFDGLDIAKDPFYEKHLNAHYVIYFDVAQFVKTDTDAEFGLSELEDVIVYELGNKYKLTFFRENKLIPLLEKIYRKTYKGFVFIIDEWDSPFREESDDRKGQEQYIRFLKDLLEDRDYVSLVYKTGIFPACGCPGGDALGFFCRSSMTDPGPLNDCVGFTEEDVSRFCEGAKFTQETIRKWYGGNNLDGARLYNSNSVHRALGEGELWEGWGETGAYVVLAEKVTKNAGGFYDVIFGLMTKERLAFPFFHTEKHNVISPVTEGDFLAVLIHDGFVSYNLKDGAIEIPNHEIRSLFVAAMREMEPYPLAKCYEYSKNLLEATQKMKAYRAAEALGRIFSEFSKKPEYADGTSFVRVAYMAVNDCYEVVTDAPTRWTRKADLVLYPDPDIAEPWMSYLPWIVVELKKVVQGEVTMDGTAEEKYGDFLEQRGYHGDVIHVILDSKKMTPEERGTIAEENAAARNEGGDGTYSFGIDAAMKTKTRVVHFCVLRK